MNAEKVRTKQIRSLAMDALVSAGASLLLVIYLTGAKGLTWPAAHFFFYFFLVMVLLAVVNPNSVLHQYKAGKNKMTIILSLAAIIGTSAVTYVPMGWNDIWNGTITNGSRDQYEQLTDAILDGHIDLHYNEDHTELSAMENPYDTEARRVQKVKFYWDTAFYNDHYYMYFGVVPVIVLMLPYRIITGHNLITWQVTGIFAVLSIIAVFLIGYEIIRKYAASVPVTVYVVLCTCVSTLLNWFAVKYPALYCTAIVSGVCFALYSFFFMFKAFVLDEQPHGVDVVLGSLFGALVFGCRPPVGLSEIVYFPMAAHYIHGHLHEKRQIAQKAICSLVPYIIVAALLMAYNYVRFGRVTEFGQSYQLSVMDQRIYATSIWNRLSFSGWLDFAREYLFACYPMTKSFPWIDLKLGLFYMCPLLVLSFPKWRAPEPEEKGLFRSIHLVMILSTAIIIEAQVLNVPNSWLRYRMDFQFILAICAMIFIFGQYSPGSGKRPSKWFSLLIILLCLYTMVFLFLEFFTSGDYAIIDVKQCTDIVNALGRFFIFRDLR